MDLSRERLGDAYHANDPHLRADAERAVAGGEATTAMLAGSPLRISSGGVPPGGSLPSRPVTT